MSYSKWEYKCLGEVCKIKGGKRLPKGKMLTTMPTNHPYIRIRDMYQHKYINLNQELEFVDNETFQSIKRYTVNTGDVIIAIVGNTIGLVSVIGYTLDGASLTENCVKLVELKDVISEYLYYYLNSVIGQGEIRKRIIGTSQPKLPIYNIEKIPIIAPSVEEQEKIVSILATIDKKIETNNQINRNLQSLSQLLFKHWFVDFEFPNEEGLPFKSSGGEMVDSELGIIPKAWRVKTIEDVCERVGSGGTPSRKNGEYYGGEILWLKTKELDDNFVFNSEEKITQIGLEQSSAKVFPPKTIMMAMYGATVGKLGIISKELSFNQATCGMVVNQNILCYEFLYLWLIKERNNIINLATGSAQQNLSVGLIKSYRTLVPVNKCIIEFNKVVKPLFEMIENIQKENYNLIELRDTLLPKLMNGEIDLSNLEINQ
jgi:type I restriction enzyme, S subunit